MLKPISDFIDQHFAKFLTGLIILIFFLGIVTSVIDCSELTHHAKRGNLIDKWHEISCIGNYDGSGNYIGESCGDEYTLAIDFGNERFTKKMSHLDFDLFKIGEAINYQYDSGKLGSIHNEVLSHVD